MEISKEIKNSVKDTIGYGEASNKESFMVGANIAFYRSEEYFKSVIKSLEDQVTNYKSAYELVSNDMKTLTSILNRYSENE